MSQDTEPASESSTTSSLAYRPPESYDVSAEKTQRSPIIVGVLLLIYACGLQWLLLAFTPALIPPKPPTYTTGTGSTLLIIAETLCLVLVIGGIGLFCRTRWSRPLAAGLLIVAGLLMLAIVFSLGPPGIILGFVLIYLLVVKPLIGLLE